MNYFIVFIEGSPTPANRIFVERLEEQDVNFAYFFLGSWLIVDRHKRITISDLRVCVSNLFGEQRKSLVLEVDPKSWAGVGPEKLSSWLEEKWPMTPQPHEAHSQPANQTAALHESL
ncbi:MAG: hypothetical protein AAF514_01155 [Verrucomicrobiota bacterium]